MTLYFICSYLILIFKCCLSFQILSEAIVHVEQMWYSVCLSCFEGSSALLRIRGFMQSFQEPCDFQSSAVEVFYRPHHTLLIRQGERKRGSEAEQERKSASAAVYTHSSVDRHQFTSLWTHAVSHSLRQTDR